MLIANYQIPFPMPWNIPAVDFALPLINQGHMEQLPAWFRTFLPWFTFLPELRQGEFPEFALHMQVNKALDSLFTHRSDCTIIPACLQKVLDLLLRPME